MVSNDYVTILEPVWHRSVMVEDVGSRNGCKGNGTLMPTKLNHSYIMYFYITIPVIQNSRIFHVAKGSFSLNLLLISF